MSLQICPNCSKENSYFKIYKEINRCHLKKWMSIKCDFCWKDMVLDMKERNIFSRILSWFLWMLPAFILIFLVWSWKMNFLVAIVLITIFHFLAMYFLIKNMKNK